jgi:hypothetical protein
LKQKISPVLSPFFYLPYLYIFSHSSGKGQSLKKIALIVLSLLITGCNIFNPGDAKIAKLDAPGYVDEGQKRIRLGEYDKAMTAFNNAAGLDPASSEAWYGVAKVAYLQAGFNMVDLFAAFAGADTSLPFFSWTTGRQDTLYVASRTAKLALVHIIDTLGSDKIIKTNWVKLDYITTLSIHSVLRLRDFNGDGRINSGDDFIKMLNIKVTKNGLQIQNFEEMIAADSGKSFNGFLDAAGSFVVDIYGDIKSLIGSPSDTSKEAKLDEVVQTIAAGMSFYKACDFLDNDGDWWDTNSDGLQNPMVWTDLDGDGKIDIGTPVGLTHQHFTRDSAYISAPPYFYVRLDAANFARRPDLQVKWPRVNNVLIFSDRIVYIGPPSGEWTSGDFGVDEEIRNKSDDDNDGMINEDSRLAP